MKSEESSGIDIWVYLGGAAITAFGALIASIIAAIIGKICIKKAGKQYLFVCVCFIA